MRLPIAASLSFFLAFQAFGDQVISDNLSVRGKIAAGVDASSAENFSGFTILLKENNTRIRFDDTSNSGAFPNNDWQLTANDSANGGRNKFSIDDITAGRTLFTIDAGAPMHSLYVRNNGNLGVRTPNPAQALHLAASDSPGIRFEQTGSDGLTPRVWDLLANEGAMTFRDITGGNLVPFKIESNTPTNSMTLKPTGLHLASGPGGTEWSLRAEGSGTLLVQRTGQPATFRLSGDGSLTVESGAGTLLSLDASGNLTVLGAVNGSSNRDRKENIRPVDGDELLEKLARIPVQLWNYRGEEVTHIGPMAQDFYESFELGAGDTSIATVDADGIALASIQALHADSKAKDLEIEELKQAKDELERRLQKLEQMLEVR